MNIPLAQLNTIQGYNKVLEQNMKWFDSSFENSQNQFENVLQQKTMELDNPPVLGGGIELNVGLENMGPFDPVSTKDVKSASPVEKTAADFGKAFSNGLNNVNDAQVNAEQAAEIMASGGDISAHEVMIAAEKANLTMQMAVQMRNKIITAYNEINSIRI